MIPGSLAYVELGLDTFDPAQDPYDLDLFDRTVVKLWTVATLGASKHLTRWPAKLAADYLKDHGKRLGSVHKVREIREAMEHKYPVFGWLEALPVTWADLMFAESKAVIATMIELIDGYRIPTLPVHDSLIVPVSGVETAKKALARNYAHVASIEPVLKITSRLKRLRRASRTDIITTGLI
jgi:hypothetical protein